MNAREESQKSGSGEVETPPLIESVLCEVEAAYPIDVFPPPPWTTEPTRDAVAAEAARHTVRQIRALLHRAAGEVETPPDNPLILTQLRDARTRAKWMEKAQADRDVAEARVRELEAEILQLQAAQILNESAPAMEAAWAERLAGEVETPEAAVEALAQAIDDWQDETHWYGESLPSFAIAQHLSRGLRAQGWIPPGGTE